MSRDSGRTDRRLVVASALAVLVALSAVPGAVGAAQAQADAGTIVVEEGETVDGVEGVGGSIVVHGTVTGDVSGVAGSVHVAEGASVEGSIDGAAGTVRIDGTVDGDVTAGGGTAELSETGRIGEDLTVGTSYLLVDGEVGGDVRAGAETVELGANADVAGDVRYDAADFSQDPDATVGGDVVQDSSIGENVGGFSIPGWLGSAYALLANLLLGAVLLAVFPTFSRGVAARVADRPLVSGGVGLLSLIAVPVVLVLFAITVVGIPLAVAGAAAFGVGLWTASVYGQYAVGAWVLGLAGVANRWLALLVGLVGFTLLGLVPIVGGLAGLVALLLGLGALALTLASAYRARSGDRPRGRRTGLSESPGD